MTCPSTGEIRILLIDDHALFREGLARLFESEPGFKMVACCASVDEAIEVLPGNPVDVVLLDYDLGNKRGSEFLELAARTGFKGHTLVVTAGVSTLEARRLVGLGASGIFLKHDPPSLLAKSIRDVFEGRTWLPQALFKELVQGPRWEYQKELTDRERKVMRHIMEGLSNKEIAARLDLSESAVKAILQQLFDKTGVRTRSQLVRVAFEQFHGEF
jgi:DNA-binding NarL/FixJ family response regulator